LVFIDEGSRFAFLGAGRLRFSLVGSFDKNISGVVSANRANFIYDFSGADLASPILVEINLRVLPIPVEQQSPFD
jgi:hypothetical protein